MSQRSVAIWQQRSTRPAISGQVWQHSAWNMSVDWMDGFGRRPRLPVRGVRNGMRPFLPPERLDRVDDAGEAFAGAGDAVAGAKVAMHQAGLLVPPGFAAGGEDVVAIGLAV